MIPNYTELPDISKQITSGHCLVGVTVPPPTTHELGGKIVEYVKSKSMVTVYPVPERFTNPMGMLQGGILSAMFDDTIGWLTYAATARPVVSTGFNVQFIRGVKAGSPLVIRAVIMSKSRQTMLVSAEAFTKNDKQVAIMLSHNLILPPSPKHPPQTGNNVSSSLLSTK